MIKQLTYRWTNNCNLNRKRDLWKGLYWGICRWLFIKREVIAICRPSSQEEKPGYFTANIIRLQAIWNYIECFYEFVVALVYTMRGDRMTIELFFFVTIHHFLWFICETSVYIFFIRWPVVRTLCRQKKANVLGKLCGFMVHFDHVHTHVNHFTSISTHEYVKTTSVMSTVSIQHMRCHSVNHWASGIHAAHVLLLLCFSFVIHNTSDAPNGHTEKMPT